METIRTIAALALLGVLPLSPAHGEPLSADARKQLLAMAADWQVPQPTSEARLVKIGAYASDEEMFALGFVEDSDAKRALVGADYWDIPEKAEVSEVANPADLKMHTLASSSPFDPPFGVNFGLITGIQFLRRGEERFGLSLIEKSLAEEAGHPRSPFYSPADEPPTLMLARACLASALNEITSPTPDFKRIKSRIERLVADEPRLRNEATTAVLNALAENVAHELAPAGSIARLVDDYVLGGGTAGGMWGGMQDLSPAGRALILKGFEAVPALLTARHSHRFSNHLMQGFNNFPSYPMTAGQVIDNYLRHFANQDLQLNWLDSQRGYVLDDRVLAEWWKEASALGEETYIMRYILVGGSNNHGSISRELLFLARMRYPGLLAESYKTLLKTSGGSWIVAEEILQCDKLSPEAKIALFEAAIETNYEFHRYPAIRSLFQINSSLANQHLVRIIQLTEAATRKPQSAEGGDFRLSNLGSTVSLSHDVKTWNALIVLLDRCDVSMKFDLLDHLYPESDAPVDVRRAFRSIYDKFADDQAVGLRRDQRIAMRDFVHMHWANWIGVDRECPSDDSTADDWAKYRNAVREAIDKHNENQTTP